MKWKNGKSPTIRETTRNMIHLTFIHSNMSCKQWFEEWRKFVWYFHETETKPLHFSLIWETSILLFWWQLKFHWNFVSISLCGDLNFGHQLGIVQREAYCTSLPLKKAQSSIGAGHGSGLMRPLLYPHCITGQVTSQEVIYPPWGNVNPPLMCHPLSHMHASPYHWSRCNSPGEFSPPLICYPLVKCPPLTYHTPFGCHCPTDINASDLSSPMDHTTQLIRTSAHGCRRSKVSWPFGPNL